MERISVIVPVLNEAARIGAALDALVPMRQRGHEVIVVDGGSRDGTVDLACARADKVLMSPRGRAVQMNAGAHAATGDVLLFLHADTRLPAGADEAIARGLASTGRVWGRFDVHIDGRSAWLPVVARLMNLRSRATGIATGDQAMFVRRAAFERSGGFPPLEIMEDIALSARLKRMSRPICLRDTVITSGRRWDERGALRTICLMWWLRLRFLAGEAPSRLARVYDGERG